MARAVLLSLALAACAARPRVPTLAGDPLGRVEHLVVIYEENRSFDNLWGLWPGVDGLAPDPAAAPNRVQVDRRGRPYRCLPQHDVNLATVADTIVVRPCRGRAALAPGWRVRGRLPADCASRGHFPNRPFPIDAYVPAAAATCCPPGTSPPPGASTALPAGFGVPGGCTADLVHRFYEEQYQIDHGRMDRFTAGSDAAGLTQGYYDTTALPLYRYLHRSGAPPYVIADHFFHAAFGGSLLNHLWLVSGATPQWPGAPAAAHTILGPDGRPRRDGALTVAADPAGGPCPPPAAVCGDYVVNTVQPTYPPFLPPGEARRGLQLPPLPAEEPTIGDRLTAAHVSWRWYAGGWDNAAGNTTGRGWTNGHDGRCADPGARPGSQFPHCPDTLFQFHHQPFNYFASFAPGTEGRTHLADEQDLFTDLRRGRLPAVAFVKPLGAENEHPGYAGLASGERHLVALIEAIRADARDWPTTAIIVTYDENGGQWDHVPPPSGPGVSDAWGPGTRVPAMIVSPLLTQRAAVDHTAYDTTSILKTITRRFGLLPLAPRPAVPDLGHAFAADLPPLPTE
ncbi:MAG TPA: alkaline phosphatase family protein [Candidatus Binatia bacterium]|nr:alkaline phosphatase family protein [Candidatus Binatia bacterium]